MVCERLRAGRCSTGPRRSRPLRQAHHRPVLGRSRSGTQSRMGTDAITLIKNDHRLMEKMFDQLRSGKGDRRALLVEVAARLAAHSHAEEMKVYPALQQANP